MQRQCWFSLVPVELQLRITESAMAAGIDAVPRRSLLLLKLPLGIVHCGGWGGSDIARWSSLKTRVRLC